MKRPIPTDEQMLDALARDDLARLRELIDRGGNVNAADSSGDTLLHHSVHARPKGAALTLLLQAGADPDVMSRNGTALGWAVGWGHADLMRQLVEAGAGRSQRPWLRPTVDDCITPFQDALDRGSEEMAWFLFDRLDEDPYQRTYAGKTLDEFLAKKPERLELLRAMRAQHVIRKELNGRAQEESAGPSSRGCAPSI